MININKFEEFEETNEFLDFLKSKKLTDEEKFEVALNKAKPIIKQNYEEVFDEDKKRKFYQFVVNNRFDIPEYFRYINGQFVDAAISVGSDITSVNSTKKRTQVLQENVTVKTYSSTEVKKLLKDLIQFTKESGLGSKLALTKIRTQLYNDFIKENDL